MTNVIDLSRYRHSKRRVYFDKRELSLVMGVYSRQVAAGEWRDYAIDHLDGIAVFSVFRAAHEVPLCSVVKFAGKPGKPPDYALAIGARRLVRSRSLGEVLDALEQKLGLVKDG